MKRLLPLIALALIGLNAHAGLNKWVDAEGKVHYSDTPPPDAKTETVGNISGRGQSEAPSSHSPKSVAEREAEKLHQQHTRKTSKTAAASYALRSFFACSST